LPVAPKEADDTRPELNGVDDSFVVYNYDFEIVIEIVYHLQGVGQERVRPTCCL
jgi:hypothetical protein